MYVSTILFLFLGGKMIISGNLSGGSLTGILSYVMQTFNSLIMLSNVFVAIAKALASIYRVNEVLNVSPDIISGEEMNKVEDATLEFNDVSFRYKAGNGEDVLSNISFKLEEGKTLGILGATGSAKTTLVSLIPRLYDTTSGNITIGGKNIKTYDLDNLRENIAFVLQTSTLFEGSLIDNLKWANPNLNIEEINNALKLSRVDEFIDRLPDGLDTYIV
jgi:ATP-binding cassette subfamily B protein